MKLKTQKLILHFLSKYEQILSHNKTQELDSFFENFFSKQELIEILEGMYCDQDYEDIEVHKQNEESLLEEVGDNYFILKHLIEKLRNDIVAFPCFQQEDVTAFFESNWQIHYLATKKVETWDSYDKSNYNALLRKTGKTQEAYGIFNSDIKERDKYKVAPPFSRFFDTQEEAEKELKLLSKEHNLENGSLKVMLLWRLNS